MGERLIGYVCFFAFGVLLRDVAQDWREPLREARPLPAAVGYGPPGAFIPAAPASLLFPLCEEGWIASCADGRACRFACLQPLSMDDPRAVPLKSKRDFERPVRVKGGA